MPHAASKAESKSGLTAKLYTLEDVETQLPPTYGSAELRSRAARSVPAPPRPATGGLKDLWDDSVHSGKAKRRSALRGERAPKPAPSMPCWAVSVGRGSVADPGLSYNPDPTQHATLLASAAAEEERALLDAKLRAARLQPSDRYAQILDEVASAVVASSDNAAADAEFAATVTSVAQAATEKGGAETIPLQSGEDFSTGQQARKSRVHVEPRSQRAAARVALSLRFTPPLAEDLTGSLRAMKAVGAQQIASERLSALALRTGMIPLNGGVADGSISLNADGEAVVRRRGGSRPTRVFPYRMVEFPRRAPELQSLSSGRGATNARDSGDDGVAEEPSTSHPADTLAVFEGDDSEDLSQKRIAAAENGKRRGKRPHNAGKPSQIGSVPGLASGSGAPTNTAAALAAGAAVLRSGLLSTSELTGMTLQYGVKARQAWKPQS